jgi:hypothetical protein
MLLKYMGTSDFRVFKKGEDFGGQLAEPLAKDVVFSPKNNHLIDTDEAGLSAEAVDLMLAHEGQVYGEAGLNAEDDGSDPTSTAKTIKEFKDVTNLKVIPPSLHQSTFLGLKGIKNKNVTDDAPEPDADTSGGEPTEGEKKTAKAAKAHSSLGTTTSSQGGSAPGDGTQGSSASTGSTSQP